jgi:hypothetical protein
MTILSIARPSAASSAGVIHVQPQSGRRATLGIVPRSTAGFARMIERAAAGGGLELKATCWATPAATPRQQGARHPGDPGLARSSVDHQHRRLHGAGAEPVQGLLAGLKGRPGRAKRGWGKAKGPGRIWRGGVPKYSSADPAKGSKATSPHPRRRRAGCATLRRSTWAGGRCNDCLGPRVRANQMLKSQIRTLRTIAATILP